jgi:hypothetical protein
VIVPAVVLLVMPAVLFPAFWTTQISVAMPLLFLGTGLLAAATPPQDAARLDIIHPHLWGRSEGVRSALRGVAEAAAPVTFGLVSDRLFGTRVNDTIGAQTGTASAAQGHALAQTFLLFLVVVFAAGLTVLIALRTYPRDVATAQASIDNTLRRPTKAVRGPACGPTDPGSSAR